MDAMAGRSARGIGQQIRERAGSLLVTARARRAAARDPTADAPPAAGAGHIDGTGGYPPGEPAPASPAGPPDAPAALVPRWLQAVAGWSWRLLVVAAVVYLLYLVAGPLTLGGVACLAAVLAH